MNTPIPASVHSRRGKQALPGRMLRQWDLQLMAIPAVLFILIFSYVPMYGLVMAFQDYNIFDGISGSPWVGFKHFDMFFNSPDFWLVMKNTLLISFLKLLFVFPAPILLALMFNEVRNVAFKRVIQTVTYLPHFISWVIVAGFVSTILAVDGGSMNGLLIRLNLITEPVNWLSIPEYFRTILISAGVWKEIGFGSIVYLAAIAGVNPHLYEAASIDGASRVKQIFTITIPSIAPVIIIFLILAIGNILNAGFEDILVLTNNGNNAILTDVSEVIDTYVYRTGIGEQRYSFATAAGLFKSLINVILLVTANAAARKWGNQSLW
ncbi:protein lplB [Paenibacillus swuensis]|uniref:Protein lplB n=1 Tax=Paenibacillus swuensis TaxID=1178515 RepID=A0A172THC3_9BACL|nr:protein lplB [Paenibacillus swuensis]